jgi:uncharacterized membrane protein YphA (DoxX/SURF4 family)
VKTAVVIVRSLLGLLFLFASVTYWFDLIPVPPAEGAMKVFGDGLEASVYLMPTVKALELVCGAALLLGRFVPLALVLLAPITVNILLVHAFLAPEGVPLAIILVLASAFLALAHREHYRSLFRA